MVNQIDYMLRSSPKPPLIEHIGWRLVRASQQWDLRFRSEMVAAGFAWFNEARANVIPCLDRAGSRQADVARRMGISKQAVQQLVAALVEDGVIEQQADPDDRRAQRIMLSAAGMAMLEVANTVKLSIEKDYKRRLGKTKFLQLAAALDDLLDDPA
ncbi:MAG: helix-turn-helix domain-containing protein [Dokdonella sp.]